jgi:hypothetical protein
MDSSIVVSHEDGFVDLSFPVLQSAIAEDGEASFVLGGAVEGRRLELGVRVSPGILPNDFSGEGPETVFSLPNGVRLALDAESTRTIAEIYIAGYGLARTAVATRVSLSLTAVALEGDPAHIAVEAVKLKLFHETDSTDDEEGPCYFEMFLNIDLPGKRVQLNEKDFDFRVGVLNALQAVA